MGEAMRYQAFICMALVTASNTGSSQAQSWFPDEALWHYSYSSGFGQEGCVRMAVSGDTLVLGQPARKITRARETFDFISSQNNTEQLSTIIARESGGLVLIYVQALAAFDSLYDLNAVPGDTWHLLEMPDPTWCDGESWMEVTDAGTTVVSGVPLRWLSVDIHYLLGGSEMVQQDTILERVGTLGTYFLPHDPCNGELDQQEGGPLRCYSDSDIDTTRTPNVACDLVLNLLGELLPPTFSLYPNPSDGPLWVEGLPDASMSTLLIHDALGNLVASRTLASNGPIDLSFLSAGVYSCTFMTPSGPLWCVRPWVKH